MENALLVLSVVLAAVFVIAGVMKLVGTTVMRGFAEHLGFSYQSYRGIGALEVAGAAGLVLGLFDRTIWLGAAAATGLFLLMAGAVTFHVRAGDGPGKWGPAGVLGVLRWSRRGVRLPRGSPDRRTTDDEEVEMRVEVYADVACPWCRIGKNRFDQASEQAGVEDVQLVHLPYQLDPEESGEATPLTERMRRLYGEGAQAMFDEMFELGRREGVEFRFDHAIAVNTFTAHRLLAYMLARHGAGAQAAVATELFDMYFLHGGNVADTAQLVEVAARHGADAAAIHAHLESDEGADEVRDRIAGARSEGISSVPTFVFPDGRTVRGAVDVQTYASALGAAVG